MKRLTTVFSLATMLFLSSCSKDEALLEQELDLNQFEFAGTLHKSECGEYDVIVSDTTGLTAAVGFDRGEFPRFSEYNLELPPDLDGQTIYLNMRAVTSDEAWPAICMLILTARCS